MAPEAVMGGECWSWSVSVATAIQIFATRYALDGPGTVPRLEVFLGRLPAPRSEPESVLFEGLVSRLRQLCAGAKRRAVAMRAASHLRAHFADPLRMGELARIVGTTPRTLRRSLKEEFGVTIRDLHTRTRVREALRLVAAGQKVSVAALATGYGSEEHLCRAVRRVAGITPSAVRDIDVGMLQTLLATIGRTHSVGHRRPGSNVFL
jgi:AraC-like DNA-binding protein